MTHAIDRKDLQHAVLEHLREGVVVCGADGRIVTVNPVACGFLGAEAGQIVGKEASDPLWGLRRADGSALPPDEHPVHLALAHGGAVTDVFLEAPGREGAETSWLLMSAYPETDAAGIVSHVVVIMAHSDAVAAVQRGPMGNDRSLAAVFLASPIGIGVIRLSDETFVDANDAFVRLMGHTRQEVLGHTYVEMGISFDPDAQATVTKELERFGCIANFELGFRIGADRSGVVLTSMELVDFGGDLCVLTFLTDITDRKRAEEALRESEERYRLVSENVGDVIWLLNLDTMLFEYVSPSVLRLRGYTVEEVLQQSIDQSMTPQSMAMVQELLPFRVQAFMEGDESARTQVHEIAQTCKDGSIVPTEVVTTLITDEQGRVTHVQGVSRDISERKRAEEELRFREAMLEETGRIAKVGGFRFDAATGEGFWTDEVARIHEEHPKKGISRDRGIDYYVGESRDRIRAAIDDAVQKALPYDLELEIETANGARKWIHTLGRPVVENGRVVSVYGSLQDITDRKAVEDSLRQSEARFRALIEAAPDGIFIHSRGRITYANNTFARMLGAASPEALLGQEYWPFIAREYWDVVRERMDLTAKTGGPLAPLEQEYYRVDGSRVPVEVSAVMLGDSPSLTQMVFVRDITERKKVEAERESLQRQLQQSQKMESVGQLAGGIAHDFNNILMVQRGYCEMMRATLRPGDPLEQDLAQIEACTQRATGLTGQLLAFSRKQTLQPRLLDLNTVVTNLMDMLHRVIGEEIELKTELSTLPALVNADPGQLEQVLVNLAVNARDATAGGGTMTITLSHTDLERPRKGADTVLAPGRYVVLSVSDTGRGMTEEVKTRMFEPFFTTKPEGKGTGLGLSTVHGIVLQSGGDITVTSELGRGTTFTIILPAADEGAMEQQSPEPDAKRGEGQLILVVEDEPALRRLAVIMLEKLGFRAVGAENGGAALLLVENEGLRPDLIVTDVVMPGMHGGVLVDRLRTTMPDVKVIFMSGYTEDSILDDPAGTAVHFLQKPFSIASLSAAIEAALAGA